MRIFLDANILFSAARAPGAMRRLLAMAEDAGHELWAGTYVFEEARRNLVAKSPAGLAVLEVIARRIRIGDLPVGGVLLPEAAILPEKDRPVLAAAIHHRCDVLITGDRTHFGPLYGQRLQGLLILSPAQLAERLAA
ncbi:MAG: PIN domain-containing protein [Sulfuritalea sp.]|nr:PIN domain-containing protein [Sulfuritalea sp.]